MGIVNFDNLVMEVGMKAFAYANKYRTRYSVKRKQSGRKGGVSFRDLTLTQLETATIYSISDIPIKYHAAGGFDNTNLPYPTTPSNMLYIISFLQ